MRKSLGKPLKIRQSGLWLVNELYKTPLSDKDFEELQQLLLSGVSGITQIEA